MVQIAIGLLMALTAAVHADTFGTGDNAFNIDFVTISGDASSANGTNISGFSPGDTRYKAFSDPTNSYRMGTYEITNNQWARFKAAYGEVLGTPVYAYDQASTTTGLKPTNYASWYEAAQFVNWLNTSKGYQAAYKFTGEIHTNSYTLDVWGAGDADGMNLYRNKAAKYFLPTENEWVKAAYWNGTNIQTYATKAGETLFQGNGLNGGWNFCGTLDDQPWNVGSGSQELNGTYDMMGNICEWMESPLYAGDYLSGNSQCLRGGSYYVRGGDLLASSCRYFFIPPTNEFFDIGFRIASVPEPCTLLLLGVGGLMIRKKAKRKSLN